MCEQLGPQENLDLDDSNITVSSADDLRAPGASLAGVATAVPLSP